MKPAILSLIVVAAFAASADARPPRIGSLTSPARTSTFYDEARYGEFLPHSDPRGAFSSYGVAYAHPYYRNAPPVNPPTPTYSARGGYIGTYNGGISRLAPPVSWRVCDESATRRAQVRRVAAFIARIAQVE